MPQTVYETIALRAEEIRRLLERLALDHGELRYHDPRRGGAVFVGPPYSWPALEEEEGRQLQSRLRSELRELMQLVMALLLDLPEERSDTVADAGVGIVDVVEREWTFAKTAREAFESASNRLDEILGYVADLYDGSGGSPIYIPDTNALLAYPEIDRWTFGTKRFTLLLAPLVLAELDRLKVEHRNPDIRTKASGLITRIKGYRDRGDGDLRSGVTLRKGVSTLRSIAPEPRMDRSLPWLDPTNGDDRFIATVVETMRLHVRSPVTLVTGDVNMQNKAAHAAIPFVEPPERTSPNS